MLLCLLSCASDVVPADPGEQSGAGAVIDRAIVAHGMEELERSAMSFTFRDRTYGISLDDGAYTYTRAFTDSTGAAVRDVLTNEGLLRYRNDSLLTLSAKDSAAYANSVNSVRYFFLLPYGLHDPAVHTRLLDTVAINGTGYDRIEVTFDAEGGGRDHDDVYHYFFNRDNGELDYLAYTFAVEDGGLRFREAVNKRRVGGVLVQDYVNYGVDGADRDIDVVARRFRAGELPELSVIENTEVSIRVGEVADR